MTMYLMLFRQGQTAVSAALSAVSGLYEETSICRISTSTWRQPNGRSGGEAKRGPSPGDGIRFENVEFNLSRRRHPPPYRESICMFRPGESPGPGRATTASAKPH